MKASTPADKFGEFIITNLRDRAIDRFDSLAANHLKSHASLRTALAVMSPDQIAVIRRCVVASIDSGLHDFLFALGETHDFEEGIAVVVDNTNIAEQSDGLPGELFGSRGWYAKYSKHGPPPDDA